MTLFRLGPDGKPVAVEGKTRFDWRDPNMPVIRHLEQRGHVFYFLLTPEQEHAAAQKAMGGGPPSWQLDPTYFMRIAQRSERRLRRRGGAS